MLSEFARLIGVAERHAEDALYSERAAQAALGRRGFLAVGAALVAGTAFSFASMPAERFFPSGEEAGTLVYDALTQDLHYFIPKGQYPRHASSCGVVRTRADSGYWLPLTIIKPVGGIKLAADLGLGQDPYSGIRIIQPIG